MLYNEKLAPFTVKEAYFCLLTGSFVASVKRFFLNEHDNHVDLFIGSMHSFHSKVFNMKTFLKSIVRSEEHTSELQSRFDLVCRLLLEKKKSQDDVHV